MKDFYKRLKVSSTEFTAESISKAVEAGWTDDLTAHEAAYVLLNVERKAVYDRTHQALVTIGQLRANLGLSKAPGRQVSRVQDFSPPPSNVRTSPQRRPAPGRLTNSTSSSTWGVVLALGILVAAYYVAGSSSDSTSRTHPGTAKVKPSRPLRTDGNLSVPDSSSHTPPIQQDVAFDAPEVPFPGTTSSLEVPAVTAIAPFRIVTGWKNIGSNFFVKVVSARDKRVALKLFIQGGRIVDAELPLGEFEVRYAVGERWYGEELCFGPETRYYRADEVFHFTKSGDQIQGYTIELTERVGGNLDTDEMTAEDF